MERKEFNLLVLIRDYPVGLAVTKKIHNLLTRLISINKDIFIISCRSKFRQPANDHSDNIIPFISIGNDLKLSNFLRIILYYVKGLNLISKRKKADKKNILYCIGPVNIENFLFVSWAKLLRYKLVFDINEDYSCFEDQVKASSRFKIRTIRKLDIITFRFASAITVVSTHLRNKYQKRNMGNKRKILLIPVTAQENHNPEKKLSNNPLRVIYAGTFDLKDGVNDIIQGFNMFNSSFQNARLILAGKSDQQKSYKEAFRQYPNIVFKGYVPDDEFYALLRDADVMCMCRTNSGFANAGFPFKLGEYLATGNPVISTKASDISDYLTSDDAYLIDFNSPQQISRALSDIVTNPEKAKMTGLNGMKKYRKYFSPEINGKLLYDLLCSVASE
jgi:glycosyltransferase involved in cell wall biosynthesis